MPVRIGPKRPIRIFLVEWREAKGLTQDQLAQRLGVSSMTVSRWERDQHKLNTDTMAAVSEALGIEATDLYRHPDRPSADALLRGSSPEVIREALDMIGYIKQRRA